MKSNVTSEVSDQESARFIADMQRFEANVAIGNSTARGRGNKGTTKILRSYLTSLALEDFATSNQATFSEQLDQCTNEIVAMFAPDQGSWGLARKCLNIFLRQCNYNRFLYERFNLELSGEFLEIPLDRHVGEGLDELLPNAALPRWNAINKVDKPLNAVFQSAASRLAANRNLLRVHLDIELWRRQATNSVVEG